MNCSLQVIPLWKLVELNHRRSPSKHLLESGKDCRQHVLWIRCIFLQEKAPYLKLNIHSWTLVDFISSDIQPLFPSSNWPRGEHCDTLGTNVNIVFFCSTLLSSVTWHLNWLIFAMSSLVATMYFGLLQIQINTVASLAEQDAPPGRTFVCFFWNLKGLCGHFSWMKRCFSLSGGYRTPGYNSVPPESFLISSL